MLASRHENSEYMHSGSSLVPSYGDLSGFSFDSV